MAMELLGIDITTRFRADIHGQLGVASGGGRDWPEENARHH